jgi:hypothetical protein
VNKNTHQYPSKIDKWLNHPPQDYKKKEKENIGLDLWIGRQWGDSATPKGQPFKICLECWLLENDQTTGPAIYTEAAEAPHGLKE